MYVLECIYLMKIFVRPLPLEEDLNIAKQAAKLACENQDLRRQPHIALSTLKRQKVPHDAGTSRG